MIPDLLHPKIGLQQRAIAVRNRTQQDAVDGVLLSESPGAPIPSISQFLA